MTTTHTPGPWQIDYDGQVTSSTGKYIVGFHWDSFKEFCDMDSEHQGNCRLIAAAPDLLAVLQKIRDYHVNHHVLYEIDAAIARATGATA